jgi:hypothetical protein
MPRWLPQCDVFRRKLVGPDFFWQSFVIPACTVGIRVLWEACDSLDSPLFTFAMLGTQKRDAVLKIKIDWTVLIVSSGVFRVPGICSDPTATAIAPT